jgi:hypothetical protein
MFSIKKHKIKLVYGCYEWITKRYKLLDCQYLFHIKILSTLFTLARVVYSSLEVTDFPHSFSTICFTNGFRSVVARILRI